MSLPLGPVLGLDPCPGLSSLSVQEKVLVQHPGTDTGSLDPHCGKKEHTAYVHVPPMTRNEVSHGPRIPTSTDTLVSNVRAIGNGNISSILTG